MPSNTRQTADVAHVVGRKNLIINGGMQVSQRGDYTTATSFTDNALYLDRWHTNKGVGSATIQQLDRGINLVATAAYTGVLAVRQKIERKNIDHLLGSTMTLSAWVKSNDSNASVMLYDSPWKTERNTHSGNGQWEKLAITFTYDNNVEGPSGYAIMAQVGIDGVGSGNVVIANGAYIEIKDVQLELGSVATDFEHRSYGEELALCQRYFEKISLAGREPVTLGQAYQNRKAIAPFYFKVSKRVAPTCNSITLSIDGGDGNHLFTVDQSSVDMVGYVSATSSPNIGSSDAASINSIFVTADAEL